MTLDNRQRGCLVGLAVGDALGAAVEFMTPGSFEPVTDYRAGGPHGLNPGEWTDDTSMALALADSIARAGWDLNDQTHRYVTWWRKGAYSVNGRCFDIGNATRAALHRFQQSNDVTNSGDRSSRASGNGSIMRLAPVPIRFVSYFPHQADKLATLAAESSLPTHASPQCVSACRYLAIILAGLMHGLSRDEVLSAEWEPLQQLKRIEPLHSEVDAVASGSFRRLKPPAIVGSGYVVKSLEAALWAFHDAKDFREAVLRAVNLGNDADTTGAVCGQLAGAYWGELGVPQLWRDGLARRDMIDEALAGLHSEPFNISTVQPIAASSKSFPIRPAFTKIDIERLPSWPSFQTSNAANKSENEALVTCAWELASRGDLAGLRTLKLPPSPKLKAWHMELVREVERQSPSRPSIPLPTASSYWVVPGRFLAGAYPGAAEPEDHKKRISDLIAAGVRVFVSLMEANETNYEGNAFNPYEDHVRSVHPETTCIRFPVADLSVPSTAEMAKILNDIDRFLNDGQTVYVHCWGGVGRTGTVVACWLLRHGFASADDVLTKLAVLRLQDRERGFRSSPETSTQRDFVLSWHEQGPASRPAIIFSPEASSIKQKSTPSEFQGTPEAAQVLSELLDRFGWMDGFKDGPFGKNQLTATESALYAATYELRRLIGSARSDEDRQRLEKLYDLLVSGVLRSMVLARGGNDWVDGE